MNEPTIKQDGAHRITKCRSDGVYVSITYEHKYGNDYLIQSTVGIDMWHHLFFPPIDVEYWEREGYQRSPTSDGAIVGPPPREDDAE